MSANASTLPAALTGAALSLSLSLGMLPGGDATQGKQQPQTTAVVPAPSPCDFAAPSLSPVVFASDSCVVGKPFVAVFRRGYALPPGPFVAWLLISTQPLPKPISLDAVGYAGCWLMVNPDPSALSALSPVAGSIVTQQRQQLVVRWTPTADMAGAVLYAQMVHLEAGASRGVLFSDLLRLAVRTTPEPVVDWAQWWRDNR